MSKNINTNSKYENLLNNKEFIAYITFEVNYSSIAKGGHFPYYFPLQKQKRLVNNINILSPQENKKLASGLLISPEVNFLNQN